MKLYKTDDCNMSHKCFDRIRSYFFNTLIWPSFSLDNLITCFSFSNLKCMTNRLKRVIGSLQSSRLSKLLAVFFFYCVSRFVCIEIRCRISAHYKLAYVKRFVLQQPSTRATVECGNVKYLAQFSHHQISRHISTFQHYYKSSPDLSI